MLILRWDLAWVGEVDDRFEDLVGKIRRILDENLRYYDRETGEENVETGLTDFPCQRVLVSREMLRTGARDLA